MVPNSLQLGLRVPREKPHLDGVVLPFRHTPKHIIQGPDRAPGFLLSLRQNTMAGRDPRNIGGCRGDYEGSL